MSEIKIGCVCRCKQGRLGVVRTKTVKDDKTIYSGIGFDGEPWQSWCPEFVNENIDEYIDDIYDGLASWDSADY